jgi:hypothetical protein
MVDYHKAIRALHPEVVKVEETNDSITAYDVNDNVVSWDKIAADAWVDPNAYKYKRAAEYPPLSEQLDYIYHNGVEAWKTNMIQPVKDKYPKPTE